MLMSDPGTSTLHEKRKTMFRRLSRKKTDDLVDALATIGRAFTSEAEAEAHYGPMREKDLRDLADLARSYPDLRLDFKANSLKRMEGLYFAIHVDRKLTSGIDRAAMERLLTTYTRALFVKNGLARWQVVDNDFNPGHYTDGLEFTAGGTNNRDWAMNLAEEPDNPGRDHLFRSFMMYVPSDQESEVM